MGPPCLSQNAHPTRDSGPYKLSCSCEQPCHDRETSHMGLRYLNQIGGNM